MHECLLMWQRRLRSRLLRGRQRLYLFRRQTIALFVQPFRAQRLHLIRRDRILFRRVHCGTEIHS